MAVDIALLEELQSKYRVGPQFTQTFITSRYKPDFTRQDLQEIMGKMPDSMWFEFAMSTNQRGEEFMRRIQPHLQSQPQRGLDVGAGYGGFTVAYARAGMDAVGVEINEWLAGLAKANLSDFGVADCILVGDILDPALVSRLGSFDLISCNDVIEHVDDAWLALDHMTGMLNPGGSLFMEIPNKDYVSFIGSDGHFSFFGLTLLKHPLAEKYHDAFYGSGYSVGEYYDLAEYIAHLQKLGCRVDLLPSTSFQAPRRLLAMYLRLIPQYFAYLRKTRSKLPKPVSRAVDRGFARYMLKFALDGMGAVFSRSKRTQFKQRYAPAFWFIQAQKQ